MKSDNDLYYIISKELSSNGMDAALWTRSFAESGGEQEKAKAIYIKLRFAVLKMAESDMEMTPQTAGSGEIYEIRRKIQVKLAFRKRATLYGTLGLVPTSSDADVEAKIKEVTSNPSSDSSLLADIKYAVNIIGDVYAREEYDRNLLDSLEESNAVTSINKAYHADNSYVKDNVFLEWWGSKKVSVVILAVVLISAGYLAKGLFEVKKTNEVQREVVKVTERNEIGRIDNQRLEIDERTKLTNKAIDKSTELQNRSLSIQEAGEVRQRSELEYRANAGAAIIEMQQKEQEHRLKIQKERADREVKREESREQMYWACMRRNLEQGYTSYNSENSCSKLK